jgi:hypothetical protein
MFNQNPRAKLQQQVQSNKTTVDNTANEDSGLGKPNIEAPKSGKGFFNKLKDAALGKITKGAEAKLSDTMNPAGQPAKGLNKTPDSPSTPMVNRPDGKSPKPSQPQMGKRPNPSIPKFKKPK